ncbi:MAG: arginine--tRNA ligase, partial [Dehalococcoidales bacterium]|nr:arginine--tRNA ligase [Dehalococcoidales bacterium]
MKKNRINGVIRAKEQLVNALSEAASQAQRTGLLPVATLPEVTVERPQNSEFGDYATSFPLKLARTAGKNPLAIAADLVKLLPVDSLVADVQIAPPGFINFIFKNSWLTSQVDAILEAGEEFVHSDSGKGLKVQLEFVSANPTGPLHVGNGRGAILGNVLANVLKSAGYDVEQEYYVNDAGNQINVFNRSLYARYCQVLKIEYPSSGNG